MRIVVSGTHASGKSTLIADFAQRHRGFEVLPDPFELLDEEWDAPGLAMFVAQLRLSAERLLPLEPVDDVIAERGPLDFLAYLLALAEDGVGIPSASLSRARGMTSEALRHVDLLAVLPLSDGQRIRVGRDEHPRLRQTMNDVLLDLLDDPDLVGTGTTVTEIAGDPARRLAALESSLPVAR